jgi:hypothetical protein
VEPVALAAGASPRSAASSSDPTQDRILALARARRVKTFDTTTRARASLIAGGARSLLRHAVPGLPSDPDVQQARRRARSSTRPPSRLAEAPLKAKGARAWDAMTLD